MERVYLADVAVALDLGLAARTDALEAALDFAALTDTVRTVVAGPPHALLEAVAFDVSRAVLAGFPAVTQVQVRLAKPDPPGLDAAEEAVVINVARDAAHGSAPTERRPEHGPAPAP